MEQQKSQTRNAPIWFERTIFTSKLVHLKKLPFLQSLIFKDLLLFLVNGIYFAPFLTP